MFQNQAIYNDDIEAIYKLLIWIVFPADIFFYCFCLPLKSTELLVIRNKIKSNDLIKEWLLIKEKEKIPRNNSKKRDLEDALPQIDIQPINEDLCRSLRSKFNVEEDIELMMDYSKLSAFNLKETGLLSINNGIIFDSCQKNY